MDDALREIQVTAQRVERFACDVEDHDSTESRELWRAALDDLRGAIRQARAAGADSHEIREAALGVDAGRFSRPAAAGGSGAPRQVARDLQR